MAWSTPRTWVTGETVTAALMNAHIRDQFRETSPFTVSAAGDISYADAANSMNSRLAIGGAGTRLVSDSTGPVWRESDIDQAAAVYTNPTGVVNNNYADFDSSTWGSGTTVDVSITTGTRAIVHYGLLYVTCDTAARTIDVSFRVSGATTVAATNTWGAREQFTAANDLTSIAHSYIMASLSAGTNVFTLQATAPGASTVYNIANPYIIVEAL